MPKFGSQKRKKNPKISIGKQFLLCGWQHERKGAEISIGNKCLMLCGWQNERKGADRKAINLNRSRMVKQHSEQLGKAEGLSEYGRKNPNSAENYRKTPHMRAGDNREGEPAKARKTENKEN